VAGAMEWGLREVGEEGEGASVELAVREAADGRGDGGLGTFRERMLGKGFEERSPVPFIRSYVAEGLVDWRTVEEGGWRNDNESVNLGEGRWRWKRIEELAHETGGRPNRGV
jgi:hypothetical protein